MTTQKQHLQIVASSLPESIADFQVALNAAFAGGVAYGKASAEVAAAPTPGVQWTSVDERLPDPDLWMVTVDTDSGPLVYVLELNDRGHWIHEGEPTFCHSYMFRPTHWAPVPAPAEIIKEEVCPF